MRHFDAIPRSATPNHIPPRSAAWLGLTPWALALVLLFTGCGASAAATGSGVSGADRSAQPTTVAAPSDAAAAPTGHAKVHASHHVLWSYHGRYDPTHWGENFCLCRGGRKQSPIDLRADRFAPADPDRFAAVALHLRHVVNNGHTLQVGVAPAITLHIERRGYQLLQFHFHTPAEHTTSGVRAPMELHLVHRNSAGGIAVVSVLFDVGHESPWLARLWQQLPSQVGEVVPRDMTVRLADILGPRRGAYTYDGSLTTPPCSQGVRWFVMKSRQQASRAQIDRIYGIIGDNHRPIQRRDSSEEES